MIPNSMIAKQTATIRAHTKTNFEKFSTRK